MGAVGGGGYSEIVFVFVFVFVFAIVFGLYDAR